jgi:hypothetical protein
VFDDGGGPALYAGGYFGTAGGVAASRIARWDGASWSAVGGGIQGPSVWSLAVYDDGSGSALYAGGAFSAFVGGNRITKWDGASWSPLGSGVNANVNALTVYDDGSGPALYAGGDFTTAGGVAANRIAKWDGSSWSALGSGLSGNVNPGDVSALTVYDDGNAPPGLVAGGDFITSPSGDSYVARWACPARRVRRR